jgi:hypothetical protein
MNCGTLFPTFQKNNWTATQPPEVFVHADGRAATPQPALGRASIALNRLLGLLDDDDDGDRDDFGQIGPTQFAFKTAFQMINNAEEIIGAIPSGSPVVDSDGGIRITWSRNNKQVKLICPAIRKAPMYIYYSSSEGNSIQNQNVTSAALANRLSWLMRRDAANIESVSR